MTTDKNKKRAVGDKVFQVLPLIVAILALLFAAAPRDAQGKPYLGVSNFGAIHAQDTTGTATPVLMTNQTGTGAIFEARDAATPVFQVADGGAVDIDGAVDMASSLTTAGTVNFADTDTVLTGAQTITPTYTYLQTAPTAVLTLTLSTGSATDGDILIIHNIVATTTTVVDTGATAGGGDITIGQDDNAGFIFGDGVWIELFSPDNS